MVDLAKLRDANAARWSAMRVTGNVATIDAVARRLTGAYGKARYKAVEARTGVPWWFIAVVHEREASQSWMANLAQGDRWDRVSTHVPAGRGPFTSWEDAAFDALAMCPPYASRNKDWSPGGALTMLEQYNGLGYAGKGVPSPYIWSGTDQYISGKYVADHIYDPKAVDRQLGCAALIRRMAALDSSVMGGAQTPIPASPIAKKAAGPIVVVGIGVGAAKAAHSAGHPPWLFITIGVVAVVAALAVFLYLKRK
jgi:lysozyme family protein